MGHHCMAGLAYGFFEFFELERVVFLWYLSFFCDKSIAELGTTPIAVLGTAPWKSHGLFLRNFEVNAPVFSKAGD
jgi:hypothetical protein